MSTLSDELNVALDVIRKAGAEVMRLYSSFEKIEDAPADISTDADRRSQELILKRLIAEFPEDGLCAEESMPELTERASSGSRHWVVDPIDGTRGFARKNGEFSIMIGLVDQGAAVLGVVYEPAIDRVTYASKGAGCFVRQPFDAEPVRCKVTATGSYAAAILSMSRSQGADGERRMLDAFGAARAVQTYSAGIKLAQVARGETDSYLGDYLTLHDWDVCAGHILVEEAGGTVTNIHGRTITYNGSGKSLDGKGIIGTNRLLHQAALATLASGAVPF